MSSTANLGIHRVSRDDLRRLMRTIYQGHLESPISRRGLMLAKFGDIEGNLDCLIGLDAKAALALLGAVLLERGQHQAHSGGGGELLWAGPGAECHGLREPSDLVAERIAQAERRIVWSGLPTTSRSRLLQTLYAAQRGRSLEVDLILVGDMPSAQRFVDEVFVHSQTPPTCYVAAPPSPAPPQCLIVDEAHLLLATGPSALLDEPDTPELIKQALALHAPALAQTLNAQLQALCASGPYAQVLRTPK